MKSKFLWVFAMGCALGAILSSWLAPKMIVWYFTPPVLMGCNCTEAIDWALSRLQLAQWVGLGLGGLMATLIYFALGRRKVEEKLS